MKMAGALAALLAFSIATLWIPGRWALSAVEGAAFLLIVWAMRKGQIPIGFAMLAPAFLCAWGTVQLAAHWSVVPSATVDACLCWLAAFCFMTLGALSETDRLLNSILAIGTVICIAGTIQLFTSHGNVFWLFPSGFGSRVIGPFVSPNNYAAFVELLVPIALTRKIAWRLPLAAVLAATVVASGSRAGAALVLVEIVTVLALQRRARDLWLFCGLSAACVAIMGHQFLWARFAEQGDAFAVRREFLQSTIAMFRAQPLHGFGLGTWPWAYPQFALIDTGEIANHAHNEWAQWAAEGGAPALIAMLALLMWLAPRALREVWPVGILAVLVHSLVDYPFLRLGLAAWIFCLIGVLANEARLPVLRLPRPALAALLLLATALTGTIAYADSLYRSGAPDSVRRAARLDPSRADFHFALAQLDPQAAANHLEAALAANAFHTQARLALAQEREFSGDDDAAEKLLLEGARLDRQFTPAWALANFYFRRGRTAPFWTWARRAAAMSFGDRRALLDLCFSVSNDPEDVFTRIGNTQMEEPFLRYLIARYGAASAETAAIRMARHADPAWRDTLVDYVDAAIAANRFGPAWQIWGLIGAPANGRGFDWRIPASDGVYVTRNSANWRVELSGREPETADILIRAVPAGAFVLRYEYRTKGLTAGNGIVWQSSEGIVPLDRSPDWRAGELSLTGGWLRLAYRRPRGSTRAEGTLQLRNLSLSDSAKTADMGTGCCN